MANYPKPTNGIDVLASATPLAVSGELGAGEYITLLLGNHGGVLGETCALTILIGGIYLIVTKVISPVIPVTYLATVAVLSLVAGKDPIVQLLSGGLMLGAFFMATDYVTSPTTNKGKLIFGIGLGIITCAIRFLGTMNEGVSFAILLMNLLVPYIEVLTRQDKLGIAKKKKEAAAK
jgi:electron transport complex protein RnfD